MSTHKKQSNLMNELSRTLSRLRKNRNSNRNPTQRPPPPAGPAPLAPSRQFLSNRNHTQRSPQPSRPSRSPPLPPSRQFRPSRNNSAALRAQPASRSNGRNSVNKKSKTLLESISLGKIHSLKEEIRNMKVIVPDYKKNKPKNFTELSNLFKIFLILQTEKIFIEGENKKIEILTLLDIYYQLSYNANAEKVPYEIERLKYDPEYYGEFLTQLARLLNSFFNSEIKKSNEIDMTIIALFKVAYPELIYKEKKSNNGENVKRWISHLLNTN